MAALALEMTYKPKKRDYPRAPLSVQIRYGPPKKKSSKAKSRILGGGGLFIESTRPLPVGTAIELEFALPGEADPIRIEGAVVWTHAKAGGKKQSRGMGVQFRKITERDRNRILGLVMKVLMGQMDKKK